MGVLKQTFIHLAVLGISIYLMAISLVYFEYADSVKIISFVIPCYKETLRLPKMLKITLDFIKENLKTLDFEILLGNDGSPDNTWETIKTIVNENSQLKIKGLTYTKNGGKGYAVRSGMKHAIGKYILMLDADGATDVKEIKKFLDLIKSNKANIIIGSRNIESESIAERPFYRKLPSIVNNIFVTNLIGVKGIKDTQCGFKMFDRSSVKLFEKMHLNRWAFDIELLLLAQKNNYKILEVPVNWKEIEGGNLFVFQATLSFFRDYFSLFTFYNLGVWLY